ncbi:HEPACAM family member 2-like [Hypanus sabinus]|uniref:HEPACAM family member 2-like n=1 Tax=Hypanus sabinus TaxID=79690 RepID=UPI0028C509DB|nr:HEPACAM family member 2-like [Hypanus sabinus]XP_059824891.1 HEPACAM family member 2-like [Hypanus sabinus]XP_059824897.1 HEPACAM family member 2-like [Hypanus sabinus]
MDLRTTAIFIVCFTLLYLAPTYCLEVRLSEQLVWGQLGEPVELKAEYQLGVSERLHSITWRVDKDFPTRILQYIASRNATLPSAPYQHRVQFNSTTGSLCITRFTESDHGLYHITVTAVDGTEVKAEARVAVYEPASGIIVSLSPNRTSPQQNMTLKCSVMGGSKLQFTWSKDGQNVTARGWVVQRDMGQDLVLPELGWEDCGTYTCTVSNRISRLSFNLSLTASSDVPVCQTQDMPERLRFLLLTPVFLCFLLLVVLLLLSVGVGKKMFQKARMKI